jgi:hypothetical protein
MSCGRDFLCGIALPQGPTPARTGDEPVVYPIDGEASAASTCAVAVESGRASGVVAARRGGA